MKNKTEWTKPMLAATSEDPKKLKFPLLATPKLDGIRCVIREGKALTRKFLPVPNRHIRESLEVLAKVYDIEGFDGELMVHDRSFNESSGDIARHEGKPDFFFNVFDIFIPGTPYRERMKVLMTKERMLKNYSLIFKFILPHCLVTPAELDNFEAKCLKEGHEGVMVRTPDSPYKQGRSTENERYLLKIKRFADSEAKVLDVIEEMENTNTAEKDNVGNTKRSTAKAGMKGKGRMGALHVKDLKTGVEFDLGTGFVEGDRFNWWAWHQAGKAKGQIVKYKHQPSGAMVGGKPRFPVFLGIRMKEDM